MSFTPIYEFTDLLEMFVNIFWTITDSLFKQGMAKLIWTNFQNEICFQTERLLPPDHVSVPSTIRCWEVFFTAQREKITAPSWQWQIESFYLLDFENKACLPFLWRNVLASISFSKKDLEEAAAPRHIPCHWSVMHLTPGEEALPAAPGHQHQSAPPGHV